MNFSAALIAGGRSTRMGQDKALLPFRGQPFWRHGLALLRSLSPKELLLSCRSEQTWRSQVEPDVAVVCDAMDDCGPLGGLVGLLGEMQGEVLLVVAVDLPQLTTEPLGFLLEHATADCGAVFEREGRLESLAAIYPRGIAALAAKHLGERRLSLVDLIHSAAQAGLMRILPLPQAWAHQFHNVNFPSDFAEATCPS